MEGNAESCEQSSSTSLKQAKRKTFVVWDFFDRLKPNSSDGKYKAEYTIHNGPYIWNNKSKASFGQYA